MNEAEYLMKNYGDRGGCYAARSSPLKHMINQSGWKKIKKKLNANAGLTVLCVMKQRSYNSVIRHLRSAKETGTS